MTLSEPKSSTDRITEASGQLTAPQNVPTRPTQAANSGGIPRRGPSKQPNVDPMKNVGTISPPLKPTDSVTAVKRILRRNAKGFFWPS